MAKKRSNVRKFVKRPSMNIGGFIFIFIFIYLVISVIIYISRDKTIIYEVVEGSLAVDNEYLGFIHRNETLVTSEYSGSVNYFVRSNDHAGAKTVICSVDETGRVAERIKEESKKSLSDSDLTDIRNTITSMSAGFSNDNFLATYNTSEDISNRIFEFQAGDLVDNLDEYISDTDSTDFFHKITPEESGIIIYSVDGYENFSESDLSEKLFDTSEYKSDNLLSETIINKGEPIYKLITDDNWDIYVQLDETTAARLQDDSTVSITLLDIGISCNADFSIVKSEDSSYGKISLSKYLLNFSDDRYVKIELSEIKASGLKIPKSAVFSKNSYKIPKEYLSESKTFIVQYYNEKGELDIKSISPSIYYADDEYYYVSTNDFDSGDTIMLANSQDLFVVGPIQEVEGVYCVNKGYAIFKAITIIDSNDEYYIARRKSDYGLSAYDQIVLDHTTINEDEIIN